MAPHTGVPFARGSARGSRARPTAPAASTGERFSRGRWLPLDFVDASLAALEASGGPLLGAEAMTTEQCAAAGSPPKTAFRARALSGESERPTGELGMRAPVHSPSYPLLAAGASVKLRLAGALGMTRL